LRLIAEHIIGRALCCDFRGPAHAVH